MGAAPRLPKTKHLDLTPHPPPKKGALFFCHNPKQKTSSHPSCSVDVDVLLPLADNVACGRATNKRRSSNHVAGHCAVHSRQAQPWRSALVRSCCAAHERTSHVGGMQHPAFSTSFCKAMLMIYSRTFTTLLERKNKLGARSRQGSVCCYASAACLCPVVCGMITGNKVPPINILDVCMHTNLYALLPTPKDVSYSNIK